MKAKSKRYQIVALPEFSDSRGSLSFIESGSHIPFDIKRIFYLYNVAPGNIRGGHAHKQLHQFVVCLSGSFCIRINDGLKEVVECLDTPLKGIHIPPMIWATVFNFSTDAVCLVLCSDYYKEEDYYRNYNEFI